MKLKLFYNRYIFSIYKNLFYCSVIGCTIFLVNSSGVHTNKFDSFPTLENATYIWPREKQRADALDGKHVNNITENTISSFQIKHPISPCQITKLFPFLRYTNHILFSDKHTIFSSQICYLYPLLRYTQYIIFSDRHSISSFQVYKLYPLHSYSLYSLFR